MPPQERQGLTGPVHVHNAHALVLALTNSSLICLDVETIGDNGIAGVFFFSSSFQHLNIPS
jgi:hypothetical protein